MMSLSRFESRFVRLREDYPTGISPTAVLQRSLAMLADLAADTLETDAERARTFLTGSAQRIETLFQDWPDVADPLADWRRMISLCPAEDGKALRCHAIREAERMLRAASEKEPARNAGADAYRSSSMSQ